MASDVDSAHMGVLRTCDIATGLLNAPDDVEVMSITMYAACINMVKMKRKPMYLIIISVLYTNNKLTKFYKAQQCGSFIQN